MEKTMVPACNPSEFFRTPGYFVEASIGRDGSVGYAIEAAVVDRKMTARVELSGGPLSVEKARAVRDVLEMIQSGELELVVDD